MSSCTLYTLTSEDVVPTVIEQQYTHTIYILGDSLTAGYQLPLEQSYPSILERLLQWWWYPIRVINGGESWDTSAWLKDRIDWITADAKTGDIALIVIGGNDGLQWLSTEELFNNIKSITNWLQLRGIQTIIGGMQIPTNLGVDYRASFAAVYPRIAQETNSHLIPFILSGVAGVPELNLPDRIHPNSTGQQIIAQTIIDFLTQQNILSTLNE